MKTQLHISLFNVLLFFVLSLATAQAVVYVDADAAAGGNGASWATAYKYLRDALGSSREIWVAEGVYYPDQTNANPGGSGSRSDTFTLYSGCKIYGGFAGTETSRSQRNYHANRTILSGDLGENDLPSFTNYGDNSYHVVSGGTLSSLLDGLTIKAGAATAAGVAEWGGGIFSTQAVVRNCVFTLNMAALYGGGYSGSGTLINCLFKNNRAFDSGGGAYLENGVITNCAFYGNQAVLGGGAYCWGNGVTITNCTFTNNLSTYVYNRGDALYLSTYFSQSSNHSYVYNCIFWANSGTADSIYVYSGSESQATLDIDYCVIEGGSPSIESEGNVTIHYLTHNSTSNPLLVNDYRLAFGSPALDAGDNSLVPFDTTDIDGDGDTTERLPLDVDGKIRFVNDPAVDTGSGTPPLVDRGACERNGVIYVDADAEGNNNGASWYDAYLYLQDALSTATNGNEIWVAQGTYLTDRNTANPGGTGSRGAAFYLTNGVGIYGGFAGKELARTERNYLNYKSVLSGDIGTVATTTDNSYHVIYTLSNNATAVLDGFTITAGNANGTAPHNEGGGLYANGQPTIAHCIFIRNIAVYGGGVYSTSISPEFKNCAFLGNIGGYGGGIYYGHTKSTLVNCLFSGNTASINGGGIYSDDDSITTLINCTLSQNTASASGYAGGINVYGSEVYVYNCILWGNTALNGPQIAVAGGTLTAENSDIQGGQASVYVEGASTINWGTAMLNANPLFTDTDGPDNAIGGEDDNLRLLSGSPCINTGANKFVPAGITTDLDDKSRFVGTVDMGAYERPGAPFIIYVDDSALGSNTGTSWYNAYRYLQDALSIAQSGNQVWVAQGTYKPDRDTVHPAGTANRDATFLLENGVTLYGGFAGNETSLSQRNWRLYITVLNGDLAGNDGTNFTNYTENTRHVVTGSDCDGTAVLDGFTITAGNGDAAYPANSGGGMYNYIGHPTVINCIFLKNLASDRGGGIFTHGDAPAISNCSFFGNKTKSGGAINNAYGANPAITNCVFSGNIATEYGGAIQNVYSSNLTLKNCTFSDNSATIWGGAVRSYASSPTLINCILWGNTAPTGTQLSINGGGTITVSYSDVQGGQAAVHVSGSALSWGAGNVDVDPLFMDADGADNSVGTTDDDLHLRGISSVINAADPAGSYAGQSDLDGQARVLYGRADIGADEVYPAAGDFEPDEDVDLADLAYFAGYWLNGACVTPSWCNGTDMNQSGAVNLSDFVYLGRHWLWQ
jgi:parallel beta-helix repeat protein